MTVTVSKDHWGKRWNQWPTRGLVWLASGSHPVDQVLRMFPYRGSGNEVMCSAGKRIKPAVRITQGRIQGEQAD